MRRQNVELESLDMGQRLCRLEAGHVGNGAWVPTLRKISSPTSVRTPPSFRLTSSVFGPDEAPAPHDQFGAARLIVLQMRGDERGDHLALALANLRHVDLDRAGDHAEFAPRGARR